MPQENSVLIRVFFANMNKKDRNSFLNVTIYVRRAIDNSVPTKLWTFSLPQENVGTITGEQHFCITESFLWDKIQIMLQFAMLSQGVGEKEAMKMSKTMNIRYHTILAIVHLSPYIYTWKIQCTIGIAKSTAHPKFYLHHFSLNLTLWKDACR